MNRGFYLKTTKKAATLGEKPLFREWIFTLNHILLHCTRGMNAATVQKELNAVHGNGQFVGSRQKYDTEVVGGDIIESSTCYNQHFSTRQQRRSMSIARNVHRSRIRPRPARVTENLRAVRRAAAALAAGDEHVSIWQQRRRVESSRN